MNGHLGVLRSTLLLLSAQLLGSQDSWYRSGRSLMSVNLLPSRGTRNKSILVEYNMKSINFDVEHDPQISSSLMEFK